MDLHILPGAKAEDVAKAHVKDLDCQDEFGCKAITYWFDENHGRAFCLIDAPDKESVHELHKKAHGLVPNQVVQVDPALVESFLGRLTDPEETSAHPQNGLKIFEDSAHRYLLQVNVPDFILLQKDHPPGSLRVLENFMYNCLDELAKVHSGTSIDLGRKQVFYSFKELQEVLACAVRMRNACLERSELLSLQLTVNTGEPLDSRGGFFETPLEAATAIGFYGAPGKVVVSSGIREPDLSRLNGIIQEGREHFLHISAEKEIFITDLVRVLKGCYMNPELDVGLLASKLAFSNSKLYRLCRNFTGLSPNRFIREYRLLKAKELLQKSFDSISEIGFNCGFNTPSYFTRCFQQSFGVNPIDYKTALIPMNEM